MADATKIFDYLYSAEEAVFGYLTNYFKHFHIKMYMLFLLLSNLLLWFFVNYITRHVSQDLVALHYNVDFGVNLIGSAKQLYVIPLIGLVIIAINSIVSLYFVKQENFKFLSHLLLGAGILAHFFLLASLTSIYLVNFR
jgi:hypothetical protein